MASPAMAAMAADSDISTAADFECDGGSVVEMEEAQVPEPANVPPLLLVVPPLAVPKGRRVLPPVLNLGPSWKHLSISGPPWQSRITILVLSVRRIWSERIMQTLYIRCLRRARARIRLQCLQTSMCRRILRLVLDLDIQAWSCFLDRRNLLKV